MEVTEAERAPELASSSASIDLFLRRALARTWSRQELARSVPRDLRLFSEWLSKTRGGTGGHRHRSRHERLSRRPPRGQGNVRQPPVVGFFDATTRGHCENIARPPIPP